MKKFLVCLSFLWTSTAAHAHAGPPFPILVDQKAGPYVASVWNDPDVGTGTFFVVLEPNLPGTRVRIGLQPVTGRLPEAFYPTEAQPMPDGVRYFTLAPLDKEEMWRVRVFLEGPRGGGELSAEVEATPDGVLGPWASLIYVVPFLGVGLLWLKAAMRRRSST